MTNWFHEALNICAGDLDRFIEGDPSPRYESAGDGCACCSEDVRDLIGPNCDNSGCDCHRGEQ